MKRTDRACILVVDDDPAALETVSNCLAVGGHTPFKAAGGLQAIEAVRTRRPSIILCDWLMPGMDGLELCRRIKSQTAEPFVYFIMLTVQSDKKHLKEAFNVGADDFLSKPFHPEELLARISAGIRMVDLYDQLTEQNLVAQRLNAELSRLNARLRQTANTDELTGLFNRRHGVGRLKELWAMADRYGQPLSAAMIDVDNFKRINDEFGHLKGDEVLQGIGRILAAGIRTSDVACRFGGEEFLILLPGVASEQACVCLERLRIKVESASLLGGDTPRRVTVTIGIAHYTKAMAKPDDLLKAADDCLYAGKRAGRNRTVLNSPACPPEPAPAKNPQGEAQPDTPPSPDDLRKSLTRF
jgi:diguanylate cyclase (GGDEF)-like protein